WAASGLAGWSWADVIDNFKAAETDLDFPDSPIHGATGPLTVRRWTRGEMSRAQIAFQDAMTEIGERAVSDINDPSQLPGIGVFPVTIQDNGERLTTSMAYLTSEVRQRENLSIRTDSAVARIQLEGNRATGVVLENGEELAADEVVVSIGALWSPVLLMRSGIGPAAHLAEYGIRAVVDLPVGESLHDHLGPTVPYRQEGLRGGIAGPAQSLYIGASNGKDVDYHLFPIAAAPAAEGPTMFAMAAFLLRSSGQGSVRLGDAPDAEPIVTAPPLPDDGIDRLRHAFQRIAQWEKTEAFAQSGCVPVFPCDLSEESAIPAAIARGLTSYGHMTSTCPMGTVLDVDCRVLGIEGLRVVDASVMPTIPSGNTYLGCVMIAERVARKMNA
ncbi:MAG: GMC family oxidoreductase N-terminal domain-containing protein, partial [Novosphingobium sp.]|nr:GMC family oxidoreductase N-terminal domain-containing protein [Novosphingobium sp.]